MSEILTELGKFVWKNQKKYKPESHVLCLGDDDSLDLAAYVYEKFDRDHPAFRELCDFAGIEASLWKHISTISEAMEFSVFMERKAYEGVNTFRGTVFVGYDLKWFTGARTHFTEKEPAEKTEAKEMNFSEALKLIKMGDKVRRLSWDDDSYIKINYDFPESSTCGNIVCYLSIISKLERMWTPNLKDLEATDWWLVPD